MGASYRAAFPAAGRASFAADARRVYRGGIGHNGGPTWDADAAHYIERTGALYPATVNDLVLGIKAAGLWDDHVASIKLAVGVPSLAASVLDLRNPAFDGTAVNAPAHSATAGWSFTAASTHYIDGGWNPAAADSKASQNSVHVGVRAKVNTVAGNYSYGARTGSVELCVRTIQSGFQRAFLNDFTNLSGSETTAVPGHYIATRTAADARALYKNGFVIAADTVASTGTVTHNPFLGARNNNGSPDEYTTARISAAHAGSLLDATQQATLIALFDDYCAVVGEE